MTVFKGFLTIAKRNMGIVALYLIIFIAIAIMADSMLDSSDKGEFEQERVNVAVVDKDGGELAKGLTDYLEKYHNIQLLPDDKSILQDRLFYREVSYIVTIPENFKETWQNEDTSLAVTKVPGASNGYYIDSQINTFMNQMKILTAGGFSLSDAIKEIVALSSESSEVDMLKEDGYNSQAPGHSFLFQYIPYILMSILCYILSFIMIAFDKPDVKRRMLCSSIPGNRMNLQLILGYIVIGLFIWIICMLIPVGLHGKAFLTDPNLRYYLLNSFIMTLVSLSMAFLIGSFIKKDEIVSAVVNVVTLGMSFTCGVFVSMDILGKGLKTVAHFLPVYWYEIINRQLARTSHFSSSQLFSIYKSFGIQILFAAAFLGIGLVLRRKASDD